MNSVAHPYNDLPKIESTGTSHRTRVARRKCSISLTKISRNSSSFLKEQPFCVVGVSHAYILKSQVASACGLCPFLGSQL